MVVKYYGYGSQTALAIQTCNVFRRSRLIQAGHCWTCRFRRVTLLILEKPLQPEDGSVYLQICDSARDQARIICLVESPSVFVSWELLEIPTCWRIYERHCQIWLQHEILCILDSYANLLVFSGRRGVSRFKIERLAHQQKQWGLMTNDPCRTKR